MTNWTSFWIHWCRFEIGFSSPPLSSFFCLHTFDYDRHRTFPKPCLLLISGPRHQPRFPGLECLCFGNTMWEEEEEEWWDTFLCLSPFLSIPKSMIALIGFFVSKTYFTTKVEISWKRQEKFIPENYFPPKDLSEQMVFPLPRFNANTTVFWATSTCRQVGGGMEDSNAKRVLGGKGVEAREWIRREEEFTKWYWYSFKKQRFFSKPGVAPLKKIEGSSKVCWIPRPSVRKANPEAAAEDIFVSSREREKRGGLLPHPCPGWQTKDERKCTGLP